jgi:hypothetical protein
MGTIRSSGIAPCATTTVLSVDGRARYGTASTTFNRPPEGQRARFAIRDSLSAYADRTGREVNPQFYATSEFKRLVEDNEPVAVSILRERRIDVKGVLPWQN